ncbi:tetratricopeptide repeat protein [Nocardioides gansuensis]|uniref:tetratricopeptide repeat protein n=1 Tax=Nocardioides gansuensis TaxID=2138300 RepID=UPI001403D139|nr:tetratricopeptide repeat protein [Nocardioides gansuensis]
MTTDHLSSSSARRLPEGVVTLLFTDIEGSTRLLSRLGAAYSEVLSIHHRLLRSCIAAHEGYEVTTEGDAFFAAFSSPRQAVAAAVEAQRSLHSYPWPHGEPIKVRMGLHTGEPVVVDGDYVGIDVHRAARIASAGHGGQILISALVRDHVADQLPDGVTANDLGSHWLKDLPAPEHLLQLDIEGLPHRFPALKSLLPSTNVPRRAAALVGRHRERSELRELVAGSDVRLVTVTGPGGAGKTRLASAVALDLRGEHPHGVYFVDLTSVSDAADVVPAVARVLGVAIDGDGPAGQLVESYIGDRSMLLLLDNLEQVIDAAQAIGHLVAACPGLTVLATSRILLGLRDEHEYAVPPMTLPTGTSLTEVTASEAVQLFVECAGRVRRGFEVTEENAAAVAAICTMLDGLPLAIELAAARTRLFPPQALVTRLGDRLGFLTSGSKDTPLRHRTLRATIDWSYLLLSEEERRFFLDLAVFRGGARWDSIVAVVTTDTEALDLVTALVDHSLVVQREDRDGEPRFTMLQSIQEYALARLADDPVHDLELRQRHAGHMLELLAGGIEQGAAADEEIAAREYDNVRAALALWLEGSVRGGAPAGEKALRLAAALGAYWYHHGLASEGAAWLERAFAAADDPPPQVAAQALRELGVMYEVRQELDRARDLMVQALALYRELGDAAGEARCLNSLGVVARSAGQVDDAERYVREAVAIRRRTGDQKGLSTALNNLGILHLDRGDWAQARAVLAEALTLDRSNQDTWGAACTSVNLGLAHVLGGAVEAAQQLFRDALTSFGTVGDPDGVIQTLESTVGLAVARELWAAAARLAAAASEGRTQLGLPGSPADSRQLDAWVEQTRAALGRTAYEEAWTKGSAMTLEQATKHAIEDVLTD